MQSPPQIFREATEHTHRQKEQFFGIISHELRNVLNGVIGFADLLAASTLNSEQREYLEIIRKSNHTVSILLDDILEFVHLGSKKFILRYSAVNLRDLFEEVRDLYLPQAAKKGVDLTLSIKSLVPKTVRSDRTRLHQILLNLVSNALKFTSQGNVTITVYCTDFSATPIGTETCRLRVEVHDSGIGISPEQVDNLFQPFVQLDSSYTHTHSGNGLGLAICHRLAELMGGEIGLAASSSAGSIFYFSIELECMDVSLPPPWVPVGTRWVE